MAGKEEEKKKKSSSSKDDKEKKEKKVGKEDKEKSKEKKDKAVKDEKPKKDKDSKDKKDKTKKEDKAKDSGKASSKPPQPKPRAMKKVPLQEKSTDYMGDMDLPSSEDEDERYESRVQEEEDQPKPEAKASTLPSVCSWPACGLGSLFADCSYLLLSGNFRTRTTPHDWGVPGMQVTDKDKRKLADKQRKVEERVHQMKMEALRDDDSVFDVAYEQQGTSSDVLSATDVKVLSSHACMHAFIVPFRGARWSC